MRPEKLCSELFAISEIESVAIDIINEYEHDLIKEKMADVFSKPLNLEETLESVESDIRLCRGLIKRVMQYCDKRRNEVYGISSTK